MWICICILCELVSTIQQAAWGCKHQLAKLCGIMPIIIEIGDVWVSQKLKCLDVQGARYFFSICLWQYCAYDDAKGSAATQRWKSKVSSLVVVVIVQLQGIVTMFYDRKMVQCFAVCAMLLLCAQLANSRQHDGMLHKCKEIVCNVEFFVEIQGFPGTDGFQM